MSETTVVDARLDKLEQDNRRLKLTVGALLLVMAAVPLVGAVMPEQIPEVIQARAFHAIDGNGMSRAVMGEIGFAYFDVNSTIRAMMDGGSIRVSDENGTIRAMMNVGTIRLSDENGNLRASIDADGGKDDFDVLELDLSEGIDVNLTNSDGYDGEATYSPSGAAQGSRSPTYAQVVRSARRSGSSSRRRSGSSWTWHSQRNVYSTSPKSAVMLAGRSGGRSCFSNSASSSV